MRCVKSVLSLGLLSLVMTAAQGLLGLESQRDHIDYTRGNFIHADLSPRELAWSFTDEKGYFISESSVYRILKAHDLITSPAYILMSASGTFKNPTS